MRPLIGITPDYTDGIYHLKHSYMDALTMAGFDVRMLSFSNHVDGLINNYRGIVFSGGDDIHPSYYGEEIICKLTIIDTARTEFEIRLFNECLRKNMPVLGICNGMQLMNVALGGTLFQDIEAQLSVAINHKKGYHNIAVTQYLLLDSGTYSVNSAHHQAIKEKGKGVTVIARSDDGLTEAISIEGQSFALGVQWHPERDPGIEINSTLFSRFREACIASK